MQHAQEQEPSRLYLYGPKGLACEFSRFPDTYSPIACRMADDAQLIGCAAIYLEERPEAFATLKGANRIAAVLKMWQQDALAKAVLLNGDRWLAA